MDTPVKTPVKANVLIIEDNPFEAQLIANLLETMQCMPFVVDCMEAAFLAVSAIRFDVVTIDIELGGEISGIEIALKLRHAFARNQFNPKLIILTSRSLSESEKKDLFTKGIDSIYQKPLRREILEEIAGNYAKAATPGDQLNRSRL